MKTAVIGPGAMGCLFAAYLKEGGLDITLVDQLPERAARIQKHGVRVTGVRGERNIAVPVVLDAAELGVVDLVLVSVKAYHTEAALRQHRALVGAATSVWTVQNGMGNIEALTRVVSAGQVVGGSTTLGANELGPGQIHHAGEGDTLIGELQGGLSPRVEAIAVALTKAGIPTDVHEDIRRVMWSKLLVNVGINALTAVLQVHNGVLLEHEPSRLLMEAAVREGVLAAATDGMHFEPEEIIARVRQVAERTAQNRSSMLQDILGGRKTEVEFINGTIARLTDAPVNQTLTRLVLTLQATAGE